MNIIRLVLLIAAALPLMAADGLAGKWTIEGDVVGNPVNMDCTVAQKADAKIDGTCTLKGNEGTEKVTIAGDSNGDKFRFSFKTSSGYILDYSGTVKGDTIKGDIEVAGALGTFTGKRSAQ